MENSHDFGIPDADLLNSLQSTSVGYNSSITAEELESLQNLLNTAEPTPLTGFEHQSISPLLDYSSTHTLEQPPPWHQPTPPPMESQAVAIPTARTSHPALPRRRSRYLRRSGIARNVSSEPVTPAESSFTQSTLDPMQRWQESPPETEAASLSAIAGALRNTPRHSRSAERLRSKRWSVATSDSSIDSANTSYSSQSMASSRSNTSRSQKSKSKHASAARTPLNRTRSGAHDGRIFQCTFCCDTFKSKYDWSRHEKSLHLSVERWICTPFGGTTVSPITGKSHCVYCNLPDVTREHLVVAHAHGSCETESQVREFGRRDHLVQHLRQIHKVEAAPPFVDEWKVDASAITCRCGFCGAQMSSWKERSDHISRHFREGAVMNDWKGDHGFEPSIASQVANAIPPYIIGQESRSLIPFSATSSRSKDQLHQIKKAHDDWAATLGENDISQPNTGSIPNQGQANPGTAHQNEPMVSETFLHILTSGLARFARQQMSLGIVPSDEMFQTESRRLVFGHEDGWDQTIADNSQWLSTFRSTHLGQ
ncbi:hypothetical protein BJ166DRAFT_577535 [Pestalotiopsis sp. NC0098]|nr:hypothetical protein BJ166DRAFT_577535 [Pestalotiopsis sp. NC0098]